MKHPPSLPFQRMPGTVRFLALLLIPVLACAGCASKNRRKKPSMAAIPRPAYVGTVALVNADAGFVLIDQGQAFAPPVGVPLKCYTGNTESGELATGPVRKRPFLIADIRGGSPQKGDRVFLAGQEAPRDLPPTAPGATVTAAANGGVEPSLPEAPAIQLSPPSGVDQ